MAKPTTRLSCFLSNQVDSLDNNYYTATQDSCSICYESSIERGSDDRIIKTKLCGHTFHQSCLTTWLDFLGDLKDYTCPMCRGVLDKKPKGGDRITAGVERVLDMAFEFAEQPWKKRYHRVIKRSIYGLRGRKSCCGKKGKVSGISA